MKLKGRKLSAALALCALLAPATESIRAQKPKAGPADVAGIPGATPGRVAAIGAGLAGAGALIGIGVYYAVKHNHSVSGCARSGQDGMQLTSESDKQTYSLVGEVAAIKPGERVRVSGKKGKKSAATRELLVEKVTRDFGPCEVASASR